MASNPLSPGETADAALATACTALWSATLSLMAAYMQQRAPAHRLLLARRIAQNFGVLAQQESFSPSSRQSFARLQVRWLDNVRQLEGTANSQPRHGPPGGLPSSPQRIV